MRVFDLFFFFFFFLFFYGGTIRNTHLQANQLFSRICDKTRNPSSEKSCVTERASPARTNVVPPALSLRFLGNPTYFLLMVNYHHCWVASLRKMRSSLYTHPMHISIQSGNEFSLKKDPPWGGMEGWLDRIG